MTESRQFGGGRVFGDQTPGNAPGASEHCAQCESMLTDALDGVLTAEQQAVFDFHAANCGACGEMVADAKRGAAWLEMLRHPPPEPPADLLERILAQTSAAGLPMAQGAGASAAGFGSGQAALAAGYASGYATSGAARGARVIPFPRQTVAAIRRSAFGHVLLQPRLAMTAAMAFLSIALTMSITGFRPSSLRAADLKPSNLWRQASSADARVARYYENLRVVYELESRVHDLQSAQETEAPAVEQPAAQPAGQPSGQPTEKNKPASKRPAPNSGTSRRDELIQSRRFVVADLLGEESKRTARERSLV